MIDCDGWDVGHARSVADHGIRWLVAAPQGPSGHRVNDRLLQEFSFKSSSSDPPQAIEREEVGDDRLH